MTLQEVNQLASLGEGPNLEFKRKVPKPERIAKEVIAFANTRGGRLLLGVDDNGAVVGVRDAEEEAFVLERALNAHCDPPVPFQAEHVEVSHRRFVIIVHVPESDVKPHYLVNGDASRVPYVRVGENSIEASREAVRLMRDDNGTAKVTFEFGEKELMLMRYLEQYGRITVSDFARLAAVSRKRASQTLVLLTRASILRLHADTRGDYFTLAYGE